MSLSGNRCPSRQNESLSLWQLLHQLIYLVFQQFNLPVSQMCGRIEWCLTLIRREMSTYIEEVILYLDNEIALIPLFHHRYEHPQVGTQLIDRSVCF